MIRFCSLGSGSSGNATRRRGDERHHDDAPAGRLPASRCASSRRAWRAPGSAADDLDAVFVTHEHGDHIGCARGAGRAPRPAALDEPRHLARHRRARAAGAALRFARDGEAIAVGDLELHPFTVAHDAAEPLQLRCSDGDALPRRADRPRLDHARTCSTTSRGCDALLLECNHDAAMLAASRYPASLKARIGGRFGHLSNAHRGRDARPRRRRTPAPPRRRAPEPREQHARQLARAALAAAWGSRAGGHRRRRPGARLRLAADRLSASASAAGKCKKPPGGGFRRSSETFLLRSQRRSGGHRRRGRRRGRRGGVGSADGSRAGRHRAPRQRRSRSRRRRHDGRGRGAGVAAASWSSWSVSSFLLQAANETAAARVTISNAVFIFLLDLVGSDNYRQLWEPSLSKSPIVFKTRKARAFPVPNPRL